MNVPLEWITLARQWMRKAASDLKTAEHSLSLLDEECPFDTICFHAQQCAEKSLKALLTVRGIPFEWTHDLGQLLYLGRKETGLVEELSPIKSLSDYAVETRYPREETDPTRVEAERAVALARKVYEEVRRRLPRMEE